MSAKKAQPTKTRQGKSRNLIASASVSIKTSPERVWKALVDAEIIKQYMFGTNVTSEWKKGSPIVWRGTWQGKAYEDKGVILKLEPYFLIEYTHFSPLSGKPDLPENYHRVAIALERKGKETGINLSQDNNETEEARKHSESNWKQMLESLKKLLEK
jgi:uncharacterized protein YndB with AHSA1/START domain